MGATDRLRRRFAQAEKADLPLFFQSRHRADRILDRRIGVDPVLVIEVDRLDPQSLEARFARRAHVIGLAADPEERAVVTPHQRKFGRQEYLVAAAGDCLADQFLIDERPVHVGCVEEVHSLLQRPMDRRDRFLVVTRAVKFAHPHAAETDRRDGRPVAAKGALLDRHVILPIAISLTRQPDDRC